MIIDLVVNGAWGNIGRDEECWDAQAEPVELKDGISRVLAIGVDGTGRCRVVVEAPVFIGEDDEQTLVPERRVPQGFIDLRNEEFPETHIMGRMLIVGLLAEKVEVPRLNESVARQLGSTSIREKIGEELKAFLQDRRA